MTGLCEIADRLIERVEPLAAAKAEIERLTKELADLRNSTYGRMSSWPEDRNYLDEADLPFAVKADDLRALVEALKIVQAIEILRKGGGRLAVHQADKKWTSIGVVGDWTGGWADEKWLIFGGATLYAALAAAVEAKSKAAK